MPAIFQHHTVSHSYIYIDSPQGVAKGNRIMFAAEQLHWNNRGLLIGTSVMAMEGQLIYTWPIFLLTLTQHLSLNFSYEVISEV